MGGDADAIDCLRILGERLGIGIANMVNTFDPDVVVIGGGVSRAGDLLLEPARRVAQGYILEGVGTGRRSVSRGTAPRPASAERRCWRARSSRTATRKAG